MICLGLISGTSLDGVDACIVDIITEEGSTFLYRFETIGLATYPFPEGLKEKLLQISTSGSVQEVCMYNVLLGKLFAEAAKRIIEESKVEPEAVEVIGSHGQTVYHQPDITKLYGHSVSSTLQIGDPSTIANETGILTIGDFRLADMSLGGQGAPLVPYLDRIILQSCSRREGEGGGWGGGSIMLNIGGISNISAWIPPMHGSGDGRMIAFDCGPGNMIIDSLMEHFYKQPFDNNGDVALGGTPSRELLEFLVESDGFLKLSPPKSTGRERYGTDYVKRLLSKAEILNLNPPDIVATATELTAHCVYSSYKSFVHPLLVSSGDETERKLYVSGGGLRNRAILNGLKRRFQKFEVLSTSRIGIDPDGKEAICFALLAHEVLSHKHNNVPEATGAAKPAFLGKVCLPPDYSLKLVDSVVCIKRP